MVQGAVFAHLTKKRELQCNSIYKKYEVYRSLVHSRGNSKLESALRPKDDIVKFSPMIQGYQNDREGVIRESLFG